MGSNFYSSCFFHFKLNAILTLFHRAYSLTSSWQAFHSEIEFLFEFFNTNCFPTSLVYKHLNKFLNRLFMPKPTICLAPKLRFFACFPFIHDDSFRRKFSLIICQYYGALNVNLMPKNPRTIGSFFRYKERLDPLLSSCIIYKYKCPRCSSGIYIGSSKRLLKVRIDSHRGVSYRTGCKLSNPEFSSIRNHVKSCKTHINNKDFCVIGQTSNNSDLTILESLLIKQLVPSLNSQTSAIQLYLAP